MKNICEALKLSGKCVEDEHYNFPVFNIMSEI